MHTCPTCDRRFDTRRGLGVHHSVVHDERLPNRTCERCGGEFFCEYQKKYCTEECRTSAVSYAGSSNPNYRDATEETNCESCGTVFEYYPCEKDGIYCPKCVETTQWQESPALSGSDHPRWNGGKRELECEVCGDSVERYPSNVGDVVVCGQECRGRWLSEAFTGEGHPNWRGGGNEAYGNGWNEVRTAALERDDHRCVSCGITKAELGRNPDVHHVVPVRAYTESPAHETTDAHTLDNVVSLCIPCHRRAEFGKIDRETLRTVAGLPASADSERSLGVPCGSENGQSTG